MLLNYKDYLKYLLLTCAFLTSPVFADDAVEAAPTSNIRFEKAPELIMQDETLKIGRTGGTGFGNEKFNISVDFHFKNTSNHDVKRKIAFVLPPVQCQQDAETAWGGLENSGYAAANHPLKDFETTVDGKPITFTVRTEAMLGGKNITALLKNLNIPLNPCEIRVTSEGKPDPRYAANLEKYHLITESNDAAWSENIYFEWEQVFPAGKAINIHHTYTPVIGTAVPSPRPVNDLNLLFTENQPPFHPLWSSDPSTTACLIPQWIRYHLTTGAYWHGGIGLFKLIVSDTEAAPFAVNEFFSKENNAAISKTPNEMTFTIKHFVPKQDLLVEFISLPKDNSNKCPIID